MNRNIQLRFRHYLASVLIPALLIVPSLVTVLIHLHAEIDFTQKEIDGLTHVQKLNNLTHILQQIRGLNQALIQEKQTDTQEKLTKLQTALSHSYDEIKQGLSTDRFHILQPIQKLQQESQLMIQRKITADNAHHLFSKHTQLISQVINLRWRVASQSNLMLEPVLDTHFLIELVAVNLPELEESIGRARGLGSGLLQKQTLTDIDKLRFEKRLGAVHHSLEQVKRRKNIVLEERPLLQPLFACFPEQLNPAMDHFIKLSHNLIFQNDHAIKTSTFFAMGSKAIQASTACSDIFRTYIMQQLDERHQEHRLDSILVICGALFSLILVIWFVSIFYQRNQRTIEYLRNSEQKNQAIVESAVDGIITINNKGIIQSANMAVENIFGYSAQELIGHSVNKLMPSPHRESHDDYLAAYLNSGIKRIIGYTREVVGVCRNGEEFPLELAVGEFQSGGHSYFTGILHDITERKKAKEALQTAYNELEHRVAERTHELENANTQLIEGLEAQKHAESGLKLAAKVFEHASEAIIITNANGHIIDVNRAYTEITGFQKEEVLNKNPRIGKSGRHDQTFYQQMWQAILTEGQWSGEVWDRKKSGAVYPKWLTINAVKNASGTISNFVGIFSDISHIKVTEERLEQLAFYDPLTQLPNRILFKDRLQHELETAKRNQQNGAIFFIDLDRFKHVNDTLGHAAGDKLLIEASKRITACVRNSDTVARLGGDEFTVILVNLERAHDAATIAQKIIASVSTPFDLDGKQANIGASIGITLFPDDAESYDTMTKYADVAMYHAKEDGRGTYKFFEAAMNTKSAKRALMEQNLRTGLKNQEFLLHYQPKVQVDSGQIVGMEALVRWQRPDGTLVSPIDFISLAEETGLIVPLGTHILRMACHYNKSLLDSGIKPLRVAVNLSGRQFQDKDLDKLVKSILDETGLPANLLDLEVTESMMMEDQQQAIATLKQLRDIGLSISMDDFGTGYSSLSYLKKFPINTLKIDQSFVRDLTVYSDDAAIVSAIVSMAKSLKLHVVAEGVENKSQWDFLKKIECHELQGYFVSRPLKDEAFTQFVQEYTDRAA